MAVIDRFVLITMDSNSHSVPARQGLLQLIRGSVPGERHEIRLIVQSTIPRGNYYSQLHCGRAQRVLLNLMHCGVTEEGFINSPRK